MVPKLPRDRQEGSHIPPPFIQFKMKTSIETIRRRPKTPTLFSSWDSNFAFVRLRIYEGRLPLKKKRFFWLRQLKRKLSK